MDPIAQMKAAAREGWASFSPFEMLTGSVAPALVRFAGLRAGQRALDVGCGTGVVALTAARLGALVTGADLTPPLLEHARRNAELSGLDIDFQEADVEARGCQKFCVRGGFHIWIPVNRSPYMMAN
jgi:2-polyprenyl-3-methyl-5-hydroxy-6-metoxy-1,4-benzoquinol methylase